MRKYGKWQGSEFASADAVKKHTAREKSNRLEAQTSIDIVPGGVPVFYDAEERILYCDNSTHHTLVIGETGCGKTRSIDAPTILSSSLSGDSMIITDVKGELLRITGDILRTNGYNLKVLDFRNPVSSPDSWNFFECMAKSYADGNIDKAFTMVNNFVYCLAEEQLTSSGNDIFFANMAKQFIAGTLSALLSIGRTDEVNIRSLVSLLAMHKLSLKDFFTRFNDDLAIFPMVNGCITTAPETRMGILSSVDNLIQPFVGRTALTEMISTSSFKTEDFLDKTALFIIFPEESKATMRLIGFLIKQFYEELVYLAHSEFNGCLPRRVVFLLDEFGNFELQNFTETISAARSRNIRLILSIQNISQLAHYGEDGMSTILSNCPNQIYMASRDLSTAEHLSMVCGTQYRYSRGYREERNLVSVHDLQLLNKREALILRRGLSPYMTVFPDYSEIIPDEEAHALHLPPREKKNISIFDFDAFMETSYEESVSKMIFQLIDFSVIERSKETGKDPDMLMNKIIKDIKDSFDLMSGYSGYLRRMGMKGTRLSEHKITEEPVSNKAADSGEPDSNKR